MYRKFVCWTALLYLLHLSCTLALASDLVAQIQDQIGRCYKLPGSDNISLPNVTVVFTLNKDGSLATGPEVANPLEDQKFRIAAEAAIRAVKECAPYSLPAKEYDSWKKVTWLFDADVARGMKVGPREGPCAEEDTSPGPSTSNAYARLAQAEITRRARFVTSPRTASVLLRLRVGISGRVEKREVLKSSGDKEVDALALSLTFEKFGAYGIGMQAEPLEFDLTVEFKQGMIATANELEDKENDDIRRSIREAATASYIRRVRNLMTRKKTVVPNYKTPVTLLLRIHSTGTASCGRILVTSGDPLLDKHALEFVSSLKYPAFPTELDETRINVPIRINFSQRNPSQE